MSRRQVISLALALLAVSSCGDDGGSPVVDARTDAPVVDALDGSMPIDAAIDAPPATAVCTVTPGDARKVLTGNVLTPTGILANGQVAISATGTITCVGPACTVGGETVIACPDGVISPGLINTHDHITYTQNSPYNNTGERYEHRHDWRQGRRGHTRITTPGSATADQQRWGELRFLLGGATSIVGSGGASGLLRNLDQASNQEGLGQPAVQYETFPLDDSSGTQITSTCNYGSGADTTASIMNYQAYEPHIAEGIDAVARNEFLCTSSTTYDTTAPGLSNDLVQPQTAIIHALGLKPFDYGVMALDGTALIWSPRSNITLYGDTAAAQVAARMGVQIALGTDWSATGSINLLRELHCAASLNATYWGNYFTDQALWEMVTSNAAAVTATDDVIGSLVVGRVADIAIFDGRTNAGYRAIIDGEPKDVVLVMRSGKPLYGEAATIGALVPTGCDAIDVCGNAKSVCLMSEVGKTYDQLKTSSGNLYPAIQCGVPMNEPSCLPARPMAVDGSTIYTGIATAADSDGDGVPNATDNCPTVFNPIRPVDNGMQGNADGDAAGDACDVCPVNADVTTCTAVNPNDRDGDGIINAIDNCPEIANPGQEDGDGDMHGDVCDACPTISNPGSTGCPVSIYSIKSGTTTVGSVVRVENAIVTGEGTNGFFVQIKEGDVGYTSPNNSGIFVFTGAASPLLAQVAVGNRVTIDGSVALFSGQLELDSVSSVTAGTAVEAAPAPIVVTAAEVTTGGARATQLESVLVRIGASTVTALNAGQGEFTVMETGTVVVDDYLYVPAPAITVGQTFGTVTGVLALRSNVSKLEPRSAADLTPGAVAVTTFGPALSYANVGALMSPTFPTPLTVTLNGAQPTDTFVAVTSSSANLLVLGGGVTITAGQTSAPVRVTAMSGAGTVTLTAQLGTGPMLTAMVRVLDGTQVPVLTGLTPAAVNVAPNGMTTLTVTLDVPAPAGGTTVDLLLTPTTAGTLPTSVLVLADAISAAVVYQHSGADTSATVRASLGTAMFTSTITITVAPVGGLVINEVDYDQAVNPDSTEYIELYNPTAASIDLTDVALILVNGNGTPAEYKRFPLVAAGSIAAGGYLVIGAAAVVPMGAGVKYTPPVGAGANQWPATDAVQNGGTAIAPPGDGIILVNTATMTVIDKLAYEGPITVTITGFGSIDLVEGTTVTAAADGGAGAIARIPNGMDSNNAVVDWASTTTLTPGIANVP